MNIFHQYLFSDFNHLVGFYIFNQMKHYIEDRLEIRYIERNTIKRKLLKPATTRLFTQNHPFRFIKI